ncbi:MAG: histidine phosphatase family protein [Shimia sp.]
MAGDGLRSPELRGAPLRPAPLIPPIWVLRHGETLWNAEGRFQGRLNSPLTETGEAQARAQSALLAGHDLTGFRVLCSPQGRAVQTAGLALAPLVERIETDERLREIGVGEWAGLLRADVRGPGDTPITDGPDGPLGLYAHAPGGEGFAALRARCAELLGSLDTPTILVTHGITSRMLRLVALGWGDEAIAELPGGQGVVHIVEAGAHRTLGA